MRRVALRRDAEGARLGRPRRHFNPKATSASAADCCAKSDLTDTVELEALGSVASDM